MSNMIQAAREQVSALTQAAYERAAAAGVLPAGVEVANADDVVDMEAEPTEVVRQHKNSSMVIGLKMLADGAGDAFISAGSSGALLTAATLIVKRIRGIRRAAFAPLLPIGGGTGGSRSSDHGAAPRYFFRR